MRRVILAASAALAIAGCAAREPINTDPSATAAVRFAAALAEIPPLQAAGILNAAGWDCIEFGDSRHGYYWTPPTTGSPVVLYRAELWFTTTDTTFRYWLDPATCEVESCRVAGIDSLGRMGPYSIPGACAE